MKKMTNRYKILQAKVEELESILEEVESKESESHDSMSQDIKQKLAFIGNLLSAEVASHPSRPHHLHHISERFSSLETKFRQWDTSTTFSYYHDNIDKDSTCSCTESCLNDDGEALDDETDLIVFDDPQKLFPDSFGENALVEFRGVVAEDEKETGKMENGVDKLTSFVYEDEEDNFENFVGDKELVEFDGAALLRQTEEEGEKDNDMQREERRESTFGRKCCAMAGGVVIGMILMGFMMVNISDCFHYMEQVSFAIPT